MKNINGALFLCRYGDHYEWNKAVTCINNVLSQQRWLEHYGEVVIRNTASDVCTCKITFVKVRTEPHQRLTVEERQHVSSLSNSPLQKDGFIINRILSCSLKSRYWSSDNGKNEVQGVVLNRAGEVVHRFGGFWHEGIFCDTLPTPKCIWKPSEEPKICFPEHGLLIRNVNTVPLLFPYRCTTRGLLWFLRLLPLCQRIKWADTWARSSPPTYRHAFPTRPKVQSLLSWVPFQTSGKL